ncbi:MAG: DUF4177 domain-containing protein [Candidatus Muiribacteriota bacterium]
MALGFKCSYCGNKIITKYLKCGEEAFCRKCKKRTPVPISAKKVSEEEIEAYAQMGDTDDSDELLKIKEKIINGKKFQNKIIRIVLKNSFFGFECRIDENYHDIILEEVKEGWRFVQMVFISYNMYGTPYSADLIFEREVL